MLDTNDLNGTLVYLLSSMSKYVNEQNIVVDDGIEYLILKGGVEVLTTIKSILIEVNEDFKEQVVNIENILTEAGLVLKEKRHTDLMSFSDEFRQTFNQIWIRK